MEVAVRKSGEDLAWTAMRCLAMIMKDKGIRIETKGMLVRGHVSISSSYVRFRDMDDQKSGARIIDSFEPLCWCRLLRFPSTVNRTNAWILKAVKYPDPLEARITRGALSYFGHVCRDEKLGEVSFSRRWKDNVEEVIPKTMDGWHR